MDALEVIKIVNVIRRHEEDLRGIPEVSELGIGEDKDGLYIIAHLYQPTANIPKIIEGVRVKRRVE